MRYLQLSLHLLIVCLVCSSSLLLAEPSEVEFSGILKSVEKESDQVGILSVALTDSFAISVRVTGLTDIRDGETPQTLSDLKSKVDANIDATLEIRGLFTQTGILARTVNVTEEDGNEFTIRGKIDNIDAVARQIRVSGFTLQVAEEAIIKDQDGNFLVFSDLKLLQFVTVDGSLAGANLVASEITVKATTGRKSSRISFEGVVTSMDATTVMVLVEGVGAALVRRTDETEVHGELAVGELVRVIGVIDTDLTVIAHKIIVKRILQVAPHELRIGINQTRRAEVILRGTFETDVTLMIASLNESLAKPSVSTLTIPAGKVAGFFEVTAGPTPGETAIEVLLPATLGGKKVTVPVEATDAGPKGPKDPKENNALDVEWRPDQLKMKSGSSRTVQLHLNRPTPEALTATLTLNDGPPGLLTLPTLPATINFPAGTRVAEVTIAAGAGSGKAKIRAELLSGGDADDLEVEVR